MYLYASTLFGPDPHLSFWRVFLKLALIWGRKLSIIACIGTVLPAILWSSEWALPQQRWLWSCQLDICSTPPNLLLLYSEVPTPRPWLGTFILKCLFCFICIWLETSTFFLSELSLSRSLICSSYLGIGHLNHYINRNDTYLLCTKDYSKTSFPSNTETQLFKGILLLIIAWLRLLSSVNTLHWHCGSANCHFFNAFLLFYSHQ